MEKGLRPCDQRWTARPWQIMSPKELSTVVLNFQRPIRLVGGLRVEKDLQRPGTPELKGILSHGSIYQTVVLEFDRPVSLEGNLSLVKATGELYGYPVAPSDATVVPCRLKRTYKLKACAFETPAGGQQDLLPARYTACEG